MKVHKYRIFFAIQGKKMQTTVEARSEMEAEDALRNMVEVHDIRVEETWDDGKPEPSDQDIPDIFKDMLGL